MRINFDIRYRDKIESGEYKVETRNGRPVRIICWDAKSHPNHIVALIESEYGESAFWYNDTGKCKSTEQHLNDLFIVTPEEELTKFEKMLLRCLHNSTANGGIMNEDNLQKGELDFVKDYAKELLKIAHKDYIHKSEVDEMLKKQYDAAYIRGIKDGKQTAQDGWLVALRTEYDKGRASAMSELPKLHRIDTRTMNEENLKNNGHIIINSASGFSYYISLYEIAKLPIE